MATTLKPVDAVVVGFGWTGAILAKELTEAGLNVVALERGENRDTYPDGAYPNTLDELTYNTRGKLFQNLSKSTVSIRHGINDTALPYRQLSAFLPGDGVGGAGLHWSGVHFRIMPEELRLRSHYEERYGKKFIPEGMTIQDYGVSYEELEPHFDFAEKVFGTSGTAHTVKGQVVGKGNPFAADRSDDFPLPALRQVYSAQLFRKAAEELGLHPYDLPAANASGPWTNPYGVQMGPCNFCGFCSGYACYMYSKASPNLNILPALRQTPLFELRANCNVLKVNLDSDGRQATGVTYVDAQGREIVQPAKLVRSSPTRARARSPTPPASPSPPGKLPTRAPPGCIPGPWRFPPARAPRTWRRPSPPGPPRRRTASWWRTGKAWPTCRPAPAPRPTARPTWPPRRSRGSPWNR